MAASDNIDIGKSSWPKWALALLIGAPVTLGVGYYYYLRKKDISRDINSDRNGTVKPKLNVEEETSRNENCESNIEVIPQSPVERATALKNSGNELYKQGKCEDAIRLYTEAISLCPVTEQQQLAMIYQNRAAAHELLNNHEEVMSDCGKAIELNPGYMKALLRRVKAAEHLGRLKTGLEDVTALCILERFENITTLNHADRILKKLGAELAEEIMSTKPPLSPSKFFINSYFKTFVNDPIMDNEGETGDSQNLNDLKDALKDGRLDEVFQGTKAKLAEDSVTGTTDMHHYLALLLKATAFLLSGRPNLAMPDFDVIISDNPPYSKIVVNALVKRATLYLQLDESKCLEDFKTAEEIDPINCDVYYHRAQIHLYTERLDEAMRDLDKAVELAPDFGMGVVQRLYTNYRKKAVQRDSSGIEEATKQLAAAANSFPEGYLHLGQVYADQQRFEDADKAFDKARKQQPQNATVLVHKGLLELQWHTDVDKAISYLEKAIEVDSKCEYAYETLASIEVQRGNLVHAVELFEKALELAKSEKEMNHICALKAAAEAQQVVAHRLGLPNGIGVRF